MIPIAGFCGAWACFGEFFPLRSENLAFIDGLYIVFTVDANKYTAFSFTTTNPSYVLLLCDIDLISCYQFSPGTSMYNIAAGDWVFITYPTGSTLGTTYTLGVNNLILKETATTFLVGIENSADLQYVKTKYHDNITDIDITYVNDYCFNNGDDTATNSLFDWEKARNIIIFPASAVDRG